MHATQFEVCCCAVLCHAVLCCAVQADQEVDLDIMDDVMLMTDDPSMGGAGNADDEEVGGNPAAGTCTVTSTQP
jgi:hypothetical protein